MQFISKSIQNVYLCVYVDYQRRRVFYFLHQQNIDMLLKLKAEVADITLI